VTGASALRTVPAVGEACEFPHVLAGEALQGPAVALARALDQAFLAEAGWDPVSRVLFLPAEHRLMGRRVCRAQECERTVHSGLPQVCLRCFTRLSGLGMSLAEVAAARDLPAAAPRADRCAVPGCRCVPTVRQAVLCEPHAKKFRLRRPPMSMEQFLADPRVRALPPMPQCQVAACTRTADGAGGYCNPHYQRWRTAQRTAPELDHRRWQVRESGVAEPGQVNLRALPALVVLEVLFGIQQRVRGGAKVTDVDVRVLCDALRREQTASIQTIEVELVFTRPVRSLLNAVRRHVRRALADPGTEHAKDV